MEERRENGERRNGERRTRRRRKEDRMVLYFTNKIPLRRLPGIVVLGITNLIAGLFVFDVEVFSEAFIRVYLTSMVPLEVWSIFFFSSGLSLVFSGFYRRWWVFNIGATLSLFLWGAISTSIFVSLFTDRAEPSPITLAMAWWMLGGQVAMLIPPLYKKWEEL